MKQRPVWLTLGRTNEQRKAERSVLRLEVCVAILAALTEAGIEAD